MEGSKMKTGFKVLVILLILVVGHFWAGNVYAQSVGAPRLPATGRFNCSPAPCVLPPTQASEGGSIVTDSLIVSNPLNQKELLLGSFDGNCYPSALGFHLSRDGGSTWNRVLCMPFIDRKNFAYVPSFEPSVGYDRNGVAYAAGFYNDNEGGSHGLLAVQKSSDGTHWSKPVVALHDPGQTFPFETSMAIDTSPTSPRVNSLYVSGVMWTHSGRQNQILVAHSADGGVTWTQAPVDPVQKDPAHDDFTRMAVGKDGTLYLTWMHCVRSRGDFCGNNTAHMMLSKSTDGGSTWSSQQLIATVMVNWTLPNTKGERVYNYPVIAVDNSSGAHAGNLSVAMNTWTGTHLRVQVIRSTDGGKTWSKPVPLAPASDTHDQFFPTISVSPTGKVGVSWLDRRNDPNNHNYQAFAAISIDGGQTFPNTQLTTAFSNPDTNGTLNNWMGDYTGNTWAGNKFIAAWMDSSNGVDMQEVVGGIRLH
jgi:hypothetical protein